MNARKWHEAFLNRRLRMDFDHAIAAHSSWKMKLSKYLAKPDHSLQPKEIAPDDRCDLGKWIVAEGKKFANLPEFVTVKKEHTHFHKVAAEIVRRANAGEKVAEEVALGAKSEFGTASTNVVRALMALKLKVGVPAGAAK